MADRHNQSKKKQAAQGDGRAAGATGADTKSASARGAKASTKSRAAADAKDTKSVKGAKAGAAGSSHSTAGEKETTSTNMSWALLIALCVLAVIVVVAAMMPSSKPKNTGYALQGQELQEVIDRNSPLTEYVYLTPSATFPREEKIEKITIHHMAGNMSLEGLGITFNERDRRSSATYGIDVDGKVGLFVEEANRPWTSSNQENDAKAITIEVANDATTVDWHVGDATFDKLIDLIVDICERNGIEELVYTGDESGNLTYHRMFKYDTDCPGEYMISRMDDIANLVNERLRAQD